MSFIRELEMMAFGSRMKNFTDTLMRDVASIYKDLNVNFEPRWFTFFMLLCKRDDEIPVTKIAEELNQSHPAVIQVVGKLEKIGMIKTRTDEVDHRKRLVSLTTEGKELAEKMSETWEEIRKATEDYIFEVEPDFLKIIERLEDSYQKESLYSRIKKGLSKRIKEQVEIINYDKKYQKEFSGLNLLWLDKYLGITNHDLEILNHPDKMILAKGGIIKLLKYQDEIIGTYALLPIEGNDCELCKFTVKNNFRGMGFGSLMLNHALKTSKTKGYNNTFLFSHEKLEEATLLYEKSGFKKVDTPVHMSDPTGRCSFVMSISNK
ncbi:GNAT family N-acetyltransferase [Bacteroidota bacterium]